MGEAIITFLNMNLQAAMVILAVLVLRLIFSKLQIARKYICLLWLLPYLCLILPFRLESSFSIWGILPGLEVEDFTAGKEVLQLQETEATIMFDEGAASEAWGNGTPVVEEEPIKLREHTNMSQQPSTNFLTDGEVVAADSVRDNASEMTKAIVVTIVWAAGVIILFLYGVISYGKLRRKVLCSICLEDNLYVADDIAVPFVLGFAKPRIYLPVSLQHENLQYVTEHEKTHILRRDSWKKAVAFLITSIHWLNPFVWVAYYFLGKDIEMACDEETIQRIGMEKKQDYAGALLMVASGRNVFHSLAVPLAFGEGDTRSRIQNILRYKRTAGVVAGVVVVFIMVLCAVVLTEPEEVRAEANLPGISEEAEEIPITHPVMSQDIISGADGPILDYASEDTVVFHDYYGLFVYHRERGLIGAVALEPIGCQYTQGDQACQVMVEPDGSQVYLQPMNGEAMYVYDVEAAVLFKQEAADSMEGLNVTEDIREHIARGHIVEDYTVLRSDQCVVVGAEYHYLQSGSGLPIDLGWVVEKPNGDKTEQVQYIKLFEGYIADTGKTEADSNYEPIVQEEFTVEKLISLCEEGREALKSAMDEFLVKDGLGYSNFVRSEQNDSLTGSYFCELLYEGKPFRLQISYWKPETAQKYSHAEYEIDGIYLYNYESEDLQLLYTNEPERYTENLNVLAFLKKEHDMAQYLTLTLPEGLTLATYKNGMNERWNGWKLLGSYEEPLHGTQCEDSWYAPGGVGMLDVSGEPPYSINDMVSFENGRIAEIHWHLNHASQESEGEYLDGCDWQAILYEYSFDLFTAAQEMEYREKHGLKEGALKTKSKYWFVFFAEPDSEIIYNVFLNQEYFTKDDIIELARSVKFVN